MMREIALPRAIVKLTQTTMGARSPAARRAIEPIFGTSERQKSAALMSDDEIEQQKIVFLDVRARLQQVEDLILENGWKFVFVRTNHGVFE